MPNPGMQDAYRRGLTKAGVQVQFTRVTGVAPNAKTTNATVRARVMDFSSDGESVARANSSASQQGSITETKRRIIVIEDDLRLAGFPLPVKKNDMITAINGVNIDPLYVVDIDPFNRAIAGAIDLTASGTR